MNDNIDDILKDIEMSDNEFISDIKKYWLLVTSYESFDEVISAPIKSLKVKFKKVPSEEWEKLIKDYNVPAMEGDFINHFMKHFTHEELRELLNLYETHPLLQKARDKNKLIRDDTYKLTEKWLDRFNILMSGRLVEWKNLGYIE